MQRLEEKTMFTHFRQNKNKQFFFNIERRKRGKAAGTDEKSGLSAVTAVTLFL